MDLAELRSYEQARELTIDLLKQWLVKYKFKNWDIHETNPALKGQVVSVEQKEQKATDIASMLNNNSVWKSHGRPINCQRLKEIGLKIEDFSTMTPFRELIRGYYELLADYITSNKLPIFIHTRKFI